MEYSGINLKTDFLIKKLFSIHYFEFSTDYEFCGESHNFWEVVYADKGEIIVIADDKEILLKQGEIFFHMPNQWHSLKATGKSAANIAIFSFECNSKNMDFFCNKKLHCGNVQKKIISNIIFESKYAFETPMDELFVSTLKRKNKQPIGCEQMIMTLISQILISFIRLTEKKDNNIVTKKTTNDLFNKITDYMDKNISENLKISDIALFANVSESVVKQLFNNVYNGGVIEYFINLKIEYAKFYIRQSNYNFTQIAEILGYESIHYFSRQFKRIVKMTPTEYAKSIKALTGIAKNPMD